GGYFGGMVAANFGLLVVGNLVASGGKIDPEAAGYFPVVLAIGVGVWAVSAFLVWGMLWAWRLVTHRAICTRCGVKGLVVGFLISLAADLVALLPPVDALLEGPQEWIYWVVAYLVVPWGVFILMTRKAREG
ncbi:MAG TPA: hypothetical protein VHE12_07700, partial [bacterium]|nr:hypothetical protein [bacterium]